MRKLKIVLIILIVSAITSSCVYYNTFYHAKQKYKTAYEAQQKNPDGKANESNKQTYEEAIKKASKVLTFHPDSKYVDDALYLIGKSYYNTEEWRKAFEDIFRKIAYNFSILECMGRAFRMGQAWQLYQDELKRTENHGPEETHMV